MAAASMPAVRGPSPAAGGAVPGHPACGRRTRAGPPRLASGGRQRERM